jgi:hypothetical protein
MSDMRRREFIAAAAQLSSVMKSNFSDGYLEIGSVLASAFGSVGRAIWER